MIIQQRIAGTFIDSMIDTWVIESDCLGEPEDDFIYRCHCGSVFDYNELSEEAKGIESVIDYWFTTETCPDCAG